MERRGTASLDAESTGETPVSPRQNKMTSVISSMTEITEVKPS